jgi:transcriptional regulator GlxA family with amidase domain
MSRGLLRFLRHVFLVRRRLERAQEFMLRSTVTLAPIATECFVSDQALFARPFPQFAQTVPVVAAGSRLRAGLAL